MDSASITVIKLVHLTVLDFTSDSSVDSSLNFLPWKNNVLKKKKQCINDGEKNYEQGLLFLKLPSNIHAIAKHCSIPNIKNVIMWKSYIYSFHFASKLAVIPAAKAGLRSNSLV